MLCCAVLCYRLKLGAFINLDLCPVLNGQPLQMMCKNVQVRKQCCSLCEGLWQHYALDKDTGTLPSVSHSLLDKRDLTAVLAGLSLS
jgi:hypothetical protein